LDQILSVADSIFMYKCYLNTPNASDTNCQTAVTAVKHANGE